MSPEIPERPDSAQHAQRQHQPRSRRIDELPELHAEAGNELLRNSGCVRPVRILRPGLRIDHFRDAAAHRESGQCPGQHSPLARNQIQTSITSPKGRNRCGLRVHSHSAAPAANGRVLWNRRNSTSPSSKKEGRLPHHHALQRWRKTVSQPVQMGSRRTKHLPQRAHAIDQDRQHQQRPWQRAEPRPNKSQRQSQRQSPWRIAHVVRAGLAICNRHNAPARPSQRGRKDWHGAPAVGRSTSRRRSRALRKDASPAA